MRVGVVFFTGGDWLHCGFTDGRHLIDSYPGRGVTMRPLPADHGPVYWLGYSEGEAAWRNAVSRIGGRFEICASFVCQCMGQRCIMPAALEGRLRRASEK
jgi:hypothetical protein